MKKISILGSGITGKAIKKKLNQLNDFVISDPDVADCIVASPGIPPSEYPKVPGEIISEIEFAYRLFKSKKYGIMPKIIAISGTNGKTTTTTLISKLLNCHTAGNIGKPLISFVGQNNEYISCEVSSYQLESSPTFAPLVAILLNLTEDHLQRHGDMQTYCKVKAKMVLNQRESDFYIYNRNDKWLSSIAKHAKSQLIPFNSPTTLGQNIAAVRKVAEILCISDDHTDKVINSFEGVEHRLEKVTTFRSITVVNDSKATNPDSTIVALESCSKSVILILGGKDKLTSLDVLSNWIKKKVKHILLLGEASDRFETEFVKNGITKKIITRVKDMKEAVDASFKKATKNDVVLLSPACASFDMYENFEDRGEDFKKLVRDYVKTNR